MTPEEPEQKEGLHLQEGETPIPALFYQLETKATEAANHLEGLVKHYDLCVTALKHTEGGGEAITQASTGEEEETSALVGLGVDLGKLDNAPAKPITDEERKDLLHVLVKDADEVEEVVADLKDSLAEMEDSMGQITTYLEMLRETSSRLRDAMAFLKEITGKLPIYISACTEFQQAWDEERELLNEKLEELEGLRDFYFGFSGAYDELILEIQRRRQVKRDMEKVIKATMNELEALYQGQEIRPSSTYGSNNHFR
jgi:autophagy-related protein 17